MIRDSNGAQVDLPEAKLDDDSYYQEDSAFYDVEVDEDTEEEADYPGDPSLDEKFPRVDTPDEEDEGKF